MSGAGRVSKLALVYLAGAVVLLGASWPLTRYALLAGAGPAWFALGRAALSALIATVLLLALRRLRLPRRRDLPALFGIGLLQLAGFFAFAHAAVAWVPAGRTAVLANCTIVFTVPLSLLLLGEPISRRRWLATGLGAAGIVALTGPWSIDWSAPHVLLGHAELMGAALCWALAMLVVRRFPPASSMLALLPWAFGVATVALLPMALAHPPGHWPQAAVLALLAVGLVVAPAGTWCVMEAQVLLPLVVASVGFLAGPAFGIVPATLFLGEPLGPDIVIGAGLILAAAALAATKGALGMILHATDIGEGPAAILLHGLFGTASNFGTVQRRLASGRRMLAFDLRNHGRSAHQPAMDYGAMADDVLETMRAHGLEQAALVGHSMGGKVAMLTALRHPERVTRLLIADIAPVAYPPRYRAITDAMLALPLRPDLTRAAAEAALTPAVPDPVMRQFLLSNLRFGAQPSWRIGLREIATSLPAIMGWEGEGSYPGPTLVLRGERSDYILPEHRALFRQLFPAARFASLRDAGHWLHAEAPDAFVATLSAFLPAA